MKNISNIKNCYGCGVCSIICPQNIIRIELNSNGFYEPILFTKDKCTHCGLCLSVCAYSHHELAIENNEKPEGYAAWSNDEDNRFRCSSGGIGFELGKSLIKQGFNACGVRYNIKKQKAEHFITDNIKDYQESIGSKYIQSYTFDAFSSFKKNEKYFVTGTPCQIDSMRRMIRLRKIEDNFILMDFFCHGVPSILMWKKYLKDIENKIGPLTAISWRNKQTGWNDSYAITAKSNESEERYFSRLRQGDLFYKMFLSDSCLGEACYSHCKYKGTASSADIRIGDLWSPTYKDDENGVSGVVAITPKGKQVINSIKKEIILIPKELSIVTEGQMLKSPGKPATYYLTTNLLKTNLNLKYIFRIHYLLMKLMDIHNIIRRRIKRLHGK